MADINLLGLKSNIEYSEYEDCYILRIMKDGDCGISKSGKSKLVATTRGAEEMGGLMWNLNIYSPITKKAKAKTTKTTKKLIM